MSAALTLAQPDQIDLLDKLVGAFHLEAGIELSPEARRGGIQPLLDGSPHGAAYLIGPQRAPIGYIIICFGWSIEFGGMDGFVDELYIRPAVRRRGIASEVLRVLPRALSEAGLKALHLEVSVENLHAQKLYGKSGFAARKDYLLMTRRF